MDFHLNQKVTLSQESEFSSLYKWSLREHDEIGKQIGRDQIPWVWSLVFTATEMTLSEGLKLEVKTPFRAQLKPEERKDGEDDKTTVEEKDYIRAELRPGYFSDPDSGEGYSMFGTDRAIKSFQLWIYKRENETKPERSYAWGSLNHTSEIDFRNETFDDTLQFYLHVSAERFARYVEIMKAALPSIMTLRLGMVDGLYSDWSPSISTDNIKVLTNLKDHQLTIPAGCAITPPSLGRIGEFSLTFTTRRDGEKPPSLESELEDTEKEQSPAAEGLLLQRAALNLAVQQEKRTKYLSYAAWLIVGLLTLLVLRL